MIMYKHMTDHDQQNCHAPNRIDGPVSLFHKVSPNSISSCRKRLYSIKARLFSKSHPPQLPQHARRQSIQWFLNTPRIFVHR